MAGDPLPEKTIEEMWETASQLKNTQELVDAFTGASNKFWWVEDDVYDYDENTEEYKKACEITKAWKELVDSLGDRLIQAAKAEGLMKIDEEHPRSIVALTPVMEKYGYHDGRGWWVRNNSG